MDAVDSASTSETEDQTKTWGSDARPLVTASADGAGSAHPRSDCGIGHRVLASRSVLALVIDEECVFAGLQGGDIVVCRNISVEPCSELRLMYTGVVSRDVRAGSVSPCAQGECAEPLPVRRWKPRLLEWRRLGDQCEFSLIEIRSRADAMKGLVNKHIRTPLLNLLSSRRGRYIHRRLFYP